MEERPANDEMVQGFMDGYDLTAPEPSDNRSHSYRHGFMCGRIDKGKIASPGAERLRRMAEEAMDADEPQARPRVGFFEGLTAEQKKAALEYRGEDC